MKTQKWCAAILTAAVLMIAPAFADAGQRGFRNPSQRMARDLQLTPEQQHQIDPILQERRTQMQALRNDASLTPRQRRQKGREIQRSSEARINQILTPEQRVKREQMRAQARHRNKSQRHRRNQS